MTWNSPEGHRTLTNAEKRVFRSAIHAMILEMLEFPETDSLECGVAVFDNLTGCQQLVMLDYVKKYLFEETPTSNESTAVIEGTAAAIVYFIQIQVEIEVDQQKFHLEEGAEPDRTWRDQLVELAFDCEWEFYDEEEGKEDWDLFIELLHDQILYDADYADDVLDELPEVNDKANQFMGIPAEYYRALPLPEPDGPEMLDLIRRLW